MLAVPDRGGLTAVSETQRNIEALLSEQRVFEPPPSFVERALVADP
jgi:hypothetical protein